MALFVGTEERAAMEMSNFAHVIFQNVGKSYLPHAALECHYTLTQFIKPHAKDWVGIFKVGWSTTRDYHTFLWSPLPENHSEGNAVNRSVVFQGYYIPKDDGEFYQFCYITSKGEIRGASTPFQFRASSPTEEELLTMEDEAGSDILVVTTKASYLEQKMEQIQQEKKELLESMDVLQREKSEVTDERNKLQKEYEQEQESNTQLRKEVQDLQLCAQSLQEEREEVKRRMEDNTARLLQLEEDLIGVTQKGLQKETELDCLKDRVKKLNVEKENLECHLKNEKDEKELYKIHLKNRELENTKLSAELQMLKSVDVNKENTIAQLKEELVRAKACITDKDKQHRQQLASASSSVEAKALREQLRQKEEQLQATQQQANMLKAELRDTSSARDRSMAELYRMRLEVETVKEEQKVTRAQCSRLEKQLEETAQQEAQCKECDGLAVAELQREVEDLRLRLQMAAEHYKIKYKECQKLQKQVLKLTDQQERGFGSEPANGPLSVSPETSAPGSPGTSDAVLEAIIQYKLKSASKEPEKSDKYRKCKQMLCEERERCCVINNALTKMEVKLQEQMKVSENLRLQLAAEEDRYKSQVAEKGRELKELKDSLVALSKVNESLKVGLQNGRDEDHQKKASVALLYPLPYPPDHPSPLLERPSDLMFGNPYSTESRDEADGEFSDDQMPRLPPAGPPSWDSNVVCIQPARNLGRPDELEEPEQPQTVEQPAARDPPEALSDEHSPFCYEASGGEQQKRCPLCEVIFPPHYDQSKFEEHVESHWKSCPMCSEQFPLDCDQQLYEKHVLTHFDGNVVNF